MFDVWKCNALGCCGDGFLLMSHVCVISTEWTLDILRSENKLVITLVDKV